MVVEEIHNVIRAFEDEQDIKVLEGNGYTMHGRVAHMFMGVRSMTFLECFAVAR